ncbi:MAG: ArdC family protein [Synergistaceae bacterium]|nr:ArdC family protein [Synergistaceae bacterium]
MTSATGQRREEFAERVARSLDAGIVPWQRKDLPDTSIRSAVSGRNYSGINALYLMERSAEKGYTDPRFITVSEANKNGLHVRKGEHGVVLEHWTQGEDGKMKPRGYSVFNVQQLNGRLPIPETEKGGNLEKAAEMLRNAGIEIPPDSSVKDYQDAIKKLTVKNAEETGITQSVHTPELVALRCSIASTMAMREAGIPVEQVDGAPTKSWAQSIRHDPSQLSKAARDGSLLASCVIQDMTQSKDAELFRASQERAEAQKGQELVSEAATVPRGLDSNLPNADLSGVQESVLAASDKARAQVSDLRASAASRETAVGANTNKLSEARDVAKKQLGNGAIVTSAAPGRTYSGKIIGIVGDGPDKTAIQAISGNHAILHDIRDISAKSNIRIGEDVSLAANEQGYSAAQSKDPETHAQANKNELTRDGLKR